MYYASMNFMLSLSAYQLPFGLENFLYINDFESL